MSVNGLALADARYEVSARARRSASNSDPALLDHVALTVRRALAEGDGDVLCFLPGTHELTRVAGALGGLEVLTLHGRAVPRRVVLATAVAESSLTIPGSRPGGERRGGRAPGRDGLGPAAPRGTPAARHVRRDRGVRRRASRP